MNTGQNIETSERINALFSRIHKLEVDSVVESLLDMSSRIFRILAVAVGKELGKRIARSVVS